MSDYISREVATALANDIIVPTKDGGTYRHRCIDPQDIRELPAADVRPNVRGKWTKELHPNVRYNQYKCSICGEFSGHDSEGWIWKPNFCPNCGADMREES